MTPVGYRSDAIKLAKFDGVATAYERGYHAGYEGRAVQAATPEWLLGYEDGAAAR